MRQDYERGYRAEGEGNNRGRGCATSTREVRRECDDSHSHAKRTCVEGYMYSSTSTMYNKYKSANRYVNSV